MVLAATPNSVEVASLLARVALAVVFVVASVTKFRDPVGTRQGVSDLVSPRLAPFSLALPIVELIVAVGLLLTPRPWRDVASYVALALLLVFTALILRAMRLKHPPACHCFGASSAQPVGSPMVIRNIAFVVLALVSLVA